MSAKYKEYLAVNVLNEGHIVSYRALSRALKVHVNAAKEMLYDFHRQQNARKPSSVHATYLIAGLRRRPELLEDNTETGASDGNDSFMQSSPFMNSSAPNRDSEDGETILVRIILVAKEEDLDAAKAQFEQITSIHIYTLEPNSINDLQLLTNCNREIASKYGNEDPLEAWKQYGTIQNPNVKRRAKRGPPPPAPVVADTPTAKTEPRPASAAMGKDHNGSVAKQTQPEQKPSKPSRTPSASEKPSLQRADSGKAANNVKPPALKRDASSFFKSAANSNGKLKRENTGSSAVSSIPSRKPSVDQSAAQDEPMKDASEEDDEDDQDEFASTSLKKDASLPSEMRKVREERLRQMMDDDPDENMEDLPTTAVDDLQDIDEPPAAQPEKEATPEQTVTVAGGRRRGTRKVMKKKTIKDDEGYLVTKEEPAWESFSEAEPQAKKPKVANTAAAASKGKKPAGKPGQGNIMSFFGKK